MNNSVVIAGMKFGFGMAIGGTAALVGMVFAGAYATSFTSTIKKAVEKVKEEEKNNGTESAE